MHPGFPLKSTSPASDLLPPLLLALAWAVLPAAPALLQGELLGHRYTDLYPSVWGLWAFSESTELLPRHTGLLGFPQGMDWVYSSPIKGTLARGLIPLLGVVGTWNLLVVVARAATVLAAWAAARAWGLGRAGALAAAAIYGCAPFFQGYAVEGIVEGTDGWTLALWAWAIGRGRPLLAVPLMALTIASSWYLGAAGLLLAVLAAPWRRATLPSLAAPLLAAPLVLAFAGAFPEAAPLPDAVRAAMGAPLAPRPPGLAEGLNPFALSTWVGVLLPLLLVATRSRLALLALLPFALSLGVGPWFDLPGVELMRFPYRLHAATLAVLALAGGRAAEALGRPRLAWVLGPALVLEGLLLSPVEPMIPGSPTEVPAAYAAVEGPVLELPGPRASPPGEIDRSRPRSRYLLWYQVAHGQPSPWVPPFNAVGVARRDQPVLDLLAAYDPLAGDPPGPLPDGVVPDLADLGLRTVVLHRRDLGAEHTRALLDGLQAQGARRVMNDGEADLVVLALPAGGSGFR